MERPNLAYVMMLDVSGSMIAALPAVKINTNAFIACGATGDAFGINSFADKARPVYPADVGMASVTESRAEITAAASAVELLTVRQNTNIGAAISLAYGAIEKTALPLRAFVLLSDGANEIGPHPADVLGYEPSIHIAAIGNYFPDYCKALLEKNSASGVYYAPDEARMAQIFADIIAKLRGAKLAFNGFDAYESGSAARFDLPRGGDALINVVFPDAKYTWTDGEPRGDGVSVALEAPDGKDSAIRPEYAGNGFCVFRIKGRQAGTWSARIRHSLSGKLRASIACIDFAGGVTARIEGTPGGEIRVLVTDGGAPVPNADITTDIIEPGSPLRAREIRGVTSPEGVFSFPMGDMPWANIRVTAKGPDPESGLPFTVVQARTLVS